MKQTVSGKKNALNYKFLIVVFSLFSLFGAVFGSIRFFIDDIDFGATFPTALNLIFIILTWITNVLLMLHLFMSLKGQRKGIVCSVIFVSAAITSVIDVFRFVYAQGMEYIVDYTHYEFLGFDTIVSNRINAFIFISPLISVLLVVMFILVALKGNSNKAFIIILSTLGVANNLWILLKNLTPLYSVIMGLARPREIFMVISIFASISFNIAILLLGLKNDIPSVLPKRRARMTPEQALKFLKKQYDQGEITEEEYNTRRAEIISKL